MTLTERNHQRRVEAVFVTSGSVSNVPVIRSPHPFHAASTGAVTSRGARTWKPNNGLLGRTTAGCQHKCDITPFLWTLERTSAQLHSPCNT